MDRRVVLLEREEFAIHVFIGNVGDGNFRPSFYKKSNISAMDRLVVVKFHINIANRWLFITQRKIMAIHKVILTCLAGPFFSGHGVDHDFLNHGIISSNSLRTHTNIQLHSIFALQYLNEIITMQA